MRTHPAFLLLLSLAFFSSALPAQIVAGKRPPDTTKPWTRWWWPGSAVDKANLTRELEAIAAAGFGGVEITPIYGARGGEERSVPFLSPHYLELLAHVGTEARRLGLGVDMATGTGWPFGGPQVTEVDAELKLAFGHDGKIAPVPTGFKVKRAAPGGEGLVLNPYSALALTHYLAPFSTALAALPPGTIQGQFHDSFEYQANWADEIPAKFKELHGYDLLDHAAELNGRGDPDTVARIKADYRTTLGALHLDYIRTWVAWAHTHGQTARNQAHGAPGNLLDLYAAADIPETETFGSIPFPIPGFRREAAETGRPGHPPIIHRFASSAAHVMGHPLASSETFTWLREHFHESPSEMKPELDELFLAGINHVYYHGDVYSPADAPWPGWLFYASSQLNPRNPLWRDLGDGLNAYITRCQSYLQAGRPDNDLLVYWPADDLWHNPEQLQLQLTVHASWLEASPTGKLMEELTAKGYSYDLISDEQLAQTRVELNEALHTQGGFYRTILIPRTDHMPVETLGRLLTLAMDGATVLFVDALPADVPGFGRLDERRGKFKAELAKLQLASDKTGVSEAKLGRGRVLVAPLSALLAASLAVRETMADAGLRFIRRELDHGEMYFVANLSARPFDGWITLGLAAHTISILDPLTNRAGLAAVRQTADCETQVLLQLAPGESRILDTIRQSADPNVNHHWPYVRAAGAAVMLDGDWRATAVRGGPELPPAFIQHGFGPWTAQGGEWERFGGTARYEIEFVLPVGAPADDWLLELGDVRETARVFVNGHEADLVWALPMKTKIGQFLKSGKNTLALEVTNLAANRIRDLDRRHVDWKIMREINFVDINYKPFDASSWPLTLSGLLGPVTLTPLKLLSLP
jgi:hypothetical protein